MLQKIITFYQPVEHPNYSIIILMIETKLFLDLAKFLDISIKLFFPCRY